MKRILSLVLSLIMVFSIVFGMDVSVFAADKFSANKYLAQLSFGDEYIPYQTLESFYYDYQTGCEIVVDAAKKTSLESDIVAWYAIKSVANPGNALNALNYQQQYELILYNVVFDALGSEQVEEYNYENSISKVSEFTNTLVESWNSADILDKTDLTGAESEAVKDAAMTFLGKSDTKWTALGEYSALVNELAVCIESIITIGVDVIEIIDRVAIMVQLMDVGDAVISFLYDIKENANDVFLASAAQEVIDSISNDWVGIVEKVVTDVGFSFGKIATERLVNLAWGQVCSVVPFCAGMVIGDVVGTVACNALFATEDTVEEYSNMKKFIEVMSAARAAFSSTASACRNNINDDTAAKWIFSCDFMYSLIVSDHKCSVKFFEIINTKGLVNKVKNFFGGSGYEKYEDFCDSVNGILNNYESVYESFYTAWPFFMEEDYPDIYDSYIQKMNHPFETIITEVTSVDFIKDEYELAMNQTIKIPAMAYPTTAKNTSLTYSSSNTNVISVASDGTITPVGEGTADVIATSSNGVMGFCEITVYPYNVSENDVGYTIEKHTGSSSLVEIPSEINGVTVTSLGKDTFGSSGVSVINVPDTITNIDIGTFVNCYNLTAINVDENNTRYFSDGGVLFDEEKTILIKYPGKKDAANFTIPSTVTVINSSAFKGSNVSDVCIPEGVVKIGSDCFRDCENLKNIVVPNSVNNIGSTVFAGCVDLESAVLPESVENLGDGVFADCISLESVVLPNNITTLGTSLSRQVNAGNVEMPCSGFFTNCQSLKNVTIPDSVTSLGMYCFSCCVSLTTIELPASVSEISGFAFDLMQIESIEVDENNTCFSSDDGVLFNKDKTKLVRCPEGKTGTYKIPSTVTTLASHAFYYCNNLTSIELPPNKIKSDASDIGSSPFDCCYGITDIIRRKNNFATLGMLWSRIKNSCDNLRTVVCLDEFIPEAEYNAIFAYKFNSYDLNKKFFVTDDLMLENLDEYIINVDLELKPNNSSYYGTGSIIKSGDNEYSLIVKNDTNGDGVCNVLDTFDVERVSNGHIELSNIYTIAADSNSDNKIDENDYQSIVNKALTS